MHARTGRHPGAARLRGRRSRRTLSGVETAGNYTYWWITVNNTSTSTHRLWAMVMEDNLGEVRGSVGFDPGVSTGEEQYLNLGTAGDQPWSGTFHLGRTDGVASAEAVFSSGTVQTLQEHPFSDDEVNLYIAMGGTYDVGPGIPVVAHVDEARIASEAGDMSDSFDCDTLMPVQAF